MIHKINELYQNLYVLSKRISKRDRFGIYLKIENLCLEILALVIGAAFEARTNKLPLLSTARIKTEILKRLIRNAFDLKIIQNKTYIKLESDLQEISKMINGWMGYIDK